MKPLQLALVGADTDRVAALATALRQVLHEADIPIHITTQPEAAQRNGMCLLLALSAEAASAQRASQAELRLFLGQLPSGYQVIHGDDAMALGQALAAAQAHAGRPSDPSLTQRQPWVWSCEKCSDSACEHRLLSDLLAKRDGRSSRS